MHQLSYLSQGYYSGDANFWSRVTVFVIHFVCLISGHVEQVSAGVSWYGYPVMTLLRECLDCCCYPNLSGCGAAEWCLLFSFETTLVSVPGQIPQGPGSEWWVVWLMGGRVGNLALGFL